MWGNRAADVRISASFPSLNDRLIIVPQSRFFIVGLFFGLDYCRIKKKQINKVRMKMYALIVRGSCFSSIP